MMRWNALGNNDGGEQAFTAMEPHALRVDLKIKNLTTANQVLAEENGKKNLEIQTLKELLHQEKGDGKRTYAQICALTQTKITLEHDVHARDMTIGALQQELEDKDEKYRLLVDCFNQYRETTGPVKAENSRLREEIARLSSMVNAEEARKKAKPSSSGAN